MRRDMEEFFNNFGGRWPAGDVGAQVPAVNIAETKDAIEVTAELPGLDEKDIKVNLDGNRLVISGDKKQEREQKEKNWHVVERSYGAFHRGILLPFEPADNAVEASYEKGLLRLVVRKPPEIQKSAKTIEIKTGSSASTAPQATSNKAA
jgi:HSP20 family protein